MSADPVKQSPGPSGIGAAGQLLKPARPALSDWYGDPILPSAAQVLLDRTERRLRSRLCHGGRCFPLHALRMICRHWLLSDSAMDYRQLAALARDDGERALVELVYGQLLISGRRLTAREHLARGFSLAARLLDAAEYFVVLRRHELLDYLPLSDTPVKAQELGSLLTQAAVIRRLRHGERRHVGNAHHDTLG
jgi:hypothetical protein